MSTATYERHLYAVPEVPPITKARFATLLALRDAAYRAFDKALSLPRSAIRWAIDLFHRWVEATGSIGVLSWVSARARDAAGLLRQVGILPSALAVLSMPPVAAAALRVAKFAGRAIVSVAKAAWTGIKSLLGRFGNIGKQIEESLRRAGTQVSNLGKTVAHHPVMTPIVNAVKATLALIRPFTQGFVVSRILSALVPVMWVRAVIGFVLMPFLVDSTLAGNVRDCVWTPSTDQADGDVTSDGLLIDTLAAPVPMDSNGNTPGAEEFEDGEPSLNRASRRAQQRDDAQARRPQHPRR